MSAADFIKPSCALGAFPYAKDGTIVPDQQKRALDVVNHLTTPDRIRTRDLISGAISNLTARITLTAPQGETPEQVAASDKPFIERFQTISAHLQASGDVPAHTKDDGRWEITKKIIDLWRWFKDLIGIRPSNEKLLGLMTDFNRQMNQFVEMDQLEDDTRAKLVAPEEKVVIEEGLADKWAVESKDTTKDIVRDRAFFDHYNISLIEARRQFLGAAAAEISPDQAKAAFEYVVSVHEVKTQLGLLAVTNFYEIYEKAVEQQKPHLIGVINALVNKENERREIEKAKKPDVV